MSNNRDATSAYDLKSVKLPYLSGTALRLFVKLVESPMQGLLMPSLLRNAGVTDFRRRHYDEEPTFYPLYHHYPSTEESDTFSTSISTNTNADRNGFHFRTVQDYARAYREGHTTPTEVAHRFLKALDKSEAADPPLRIFIAVLRDDVLKQAEQATERIRNGRALSIFDGVPIAVKDEVDMVPYPTTVGTAFLGTEPAHEDSTIVARMRAAGALLLGKTNMHEIGLGVTGQNPHHGTPRNPYNPAHYTGGSSSGSAAAVAAGFCPVALGADGGGSIRVPASLCGVVGLKPTFGRVSEFGAAPLTWSMAHLGPLASTAADAALAYGVIAGPDAKDANSQHQPRLSLRNWQNLDLSDLTLGVFWPWFRHASADTVAACEKLLTALQNMGAAIEEIVIPDLEAGRVAHVITIVSEMAQALSKYANQHGHEHGLDVRLSLAIAREFTARDYIKAQRVRTRMIRHFERAFTRVDAILTPATGLPAPAIPDSALPNGDSDLTTLTEIMRFATPANLTGLPAVSFPAGYNAAGLPIGMQAIAGPWQEAVLLRLALAAEHLIERKRPQVFFDILQPDNST